MGHDGKDPGEFDPLVSYAYTFQPSSRTWRRRLISYDAAVGYGLDPKAADVDGDGDLDIVASGRSGLFLLENLYVNRNHVQATPVPPAPSYGDHTKLLVFKDADGKQRPVDTPAAWAIRRCISWPERSVPWANFPTPAAARRWTCW